MATAEVALDGEQRRALRDDGYVLLPGLVPRDLVEAALRAINHSLGNEGLPKELLPGFRARTFTPELTVSPAILDLFRRSPLAAVAEAAIGPGKVMLPSEGQIALRFPTREQGQRAVPHIDGISSPGNGVPPGTLYHFTALAGVFLSDVTEPDRGNLTVWPGSHLLLAAHLRREGTQSVVDRYPDLPLPPPRPIQARAGDAILAHYQLAHGIAPNLGPHVRYAVFFRLFHGDHATLGTRPLVEPWLEWETL
jgi:ectoine hydroxylase-related dioxygenase (phytanoyl-CoA dioxygenase family)